MPKVTCSKRKETGCKQVPEVCAWDGTKCNSLGTTSSPKKKQPSPVKKQPSPVKKQPSPGAPDLHAILTQYFKASIIKDTEKYVYVSFVDFYGVLDIWLDKDMNLWYIFEDSKNDDHQFFMSSKKTKSAESLWKFLRPIGRKTIDKSSISKNFTVQESDMKNIQNIENRSNIVRNIINNTKIAEVYLYGIDELPIQNLKHQRSPSSQHFNYKQLYDTYMELATNFPITHKQILLRFHPDKVSKPLKEQIKKHNEISLFINRVFIELRDKGSINSQAELANILNSVKKGIPNLQ